MTSPRRRTLAIVFALVCGLVFSTVSLFSSINQPTTRLASGGLGVPDGGNANLAARAFGNYPPASFSKPTANGIIISHDVRHDSSPALRDIAPINNDTALENEAGDVNKRPPVAPHSVASDPLVQHSSGPDVMPTPIVSFNGIGQTQYTPPDTNGEVGLTQYVQTVNAKFQVWDKQGNSLYGPTNISTIFSGFGGPCQSGGVDPVVLYDQLANRWLVSDFTTVSPYYECIAISQTSDATGAWYRYAFQSGTANLPDYPKLSVWPDAYYMTVDDFQGGQNYVGVNVFAFDRANMLLGNAATDQFLASDVANAYAMLPADLDGSTLPTAGTPDYFVSQDISDTNQTFYKYHVDWGTPANSLFSTITSLAPAPFNDLCPSSQTGYCIPQPGTSNLIDSLNYHTMFRGAYRLVNGHDSLLYTYTVDVGGGVAGVRWYEVRNLGTTPSYYQAGTYSPDSSYRWMASAAMDASGDIAVGYSVSDSSTTYPSIRYAGRLDGDPLGQLTQGETSLLAGTHSQTGSSRWGDYSDMTVDPTDDCTFWYTQEYMNTNSAWATRIGAFRFPSCVGQATPTPGTTTPVPTHTSTPLPTATRTPAATNTPLATSTPIPPTATSTAVATDTPVVTSTATPAVTATPTDCPNVFVDVTGNVFYGAIHYLNCRGVVNGVDATHYGPAGTSTRAQFAKVVVLGFGVPLSTPATPSFTDVPASYYAYVYIESGFANGILSGFDAATCQANGQIFPCYLPNNAITRGQLTKLVVSAGHYALYTPTTPDFSDVSPSNVFYASIETAFHNSVVGGYPDHTFRPNNNIRRDEMAQIVFEGIVHAP